MNGGDWYQTASREQKRLADLLFTRCRDLPLIIELRCQNTTHVIAHADYPASRYNWQLPVDEHQVLWSRQRLTDHPRDGTGKLPARIISGLAIPRLNVVTIAITNIILIPARCLAAS